MSIIGSVLLVLLFLGAVLLVVLGIVAFRNRKAGVATFFLLFGLVVIIWSGQRLHERFFMNDSEKRIADVARQIEDVKARQASTQRKIGDMEKEREILVQQIRGHHREGAVLEEEMSANPELRDLVQKTAAVRRSIRQLDQALTDLQRQEKNLSDRMEYLKIQAAGSGAGQEGARAAKSEEELGQTKDRVFTPEGGKTPLRPSEQEIQEISDMLQQEKGK